MTRTPQDIREELARNGLSIASWAREYGFSEALTYRVMRGHRATLGQSHRIAVALGLKEGGAAEISDLAFPGRSSLAVRDRRARQETDDQTVDSAVRQSSHLDTV